MSNSTDINDDGAVDLPAHKVPLSYYMSEDAKRCLVGIINSPRYWESEEDIQRYRKLWEDNYLTPRLTKALDLYPAKIAEDHIDGVRVDIVIPKVGVADRNQERILLNLHGGAFTMGAGLGGLIESIPIACEGKYKVVSVDYRQGPEYKFPAASEDVAIVYKALLNQYGAESVGIFGCSAGGLLTAMSVAHFYDIGLPTPGAIGIFCASADARMDGDSRYTTPALVGNPIPQPYKLDIGRMQDYLSDVDPDDPLVSPMMSLDVLSKFPPTLLITGTRAGEMSSCVYTHQRLTKASVDAHLHVWEGMWHGFFYDTYLPESKEAFEIICKFFDKYLV